MLVFVLIGKTVGQSLVENAMENLASQFEYPDFSFDPYGFNSSTSRQNRADTVNTSVLEQAFRDLVSLVEEPQPSKGEPFPKIPGPNRQDRVCIVGAGASGIHMALSLKKRNFTDIVIYEKSNRIGGKSFDVTIDNTVNYMGAVFIESNYFDSVVPLAKEYGLSHLVQIPTPNFFMANSGFLPGSKVGIKEYMAGSLERITGVKDPLANFKQMLLDMGRYISIHQEMFGYYKGELMLRPTSNVLHRIRGTFMDFLKRENLFTLVPYFICSQTVQGYGYLDEVGALYGLMWNNPKFVLTLALRALGQSRDPFSIYVFRDGFETIWKTIAEVEKLDIRFNSDIVKVERHYNGVDIHLYNNRVRHQEACGFIIWAAPIDEYFKTVNYGYDELALFETMKPEIFSTSLVKMTYDIRNGPYTVFIENMNRKVDHGVMMYDSSAGLKAVDNRDPVAKDRLDEKNDQEQMYTVGQMGKEFSNEEKLNNILSSHFVDNFNATNLEILQTMSWEYFPR